MYSTGDPNNNPNKDCTDSKGKIVVVAKIPEILSIYGNSLQSVYLVSSAGVLH